MVRHFKNEISLRQAQEYEKHGFLALAAIEYLGYHEYFEESEFPWGMDAETANYAHNKYYELLKKLPYAQLSKTSFIKGCQCPRALWLYKNKYDEGRVTEEQKEKFRIGHIVGLMAQKLFVDGKDASKYIKTDNFKLKQNLWIEQTRELIEDGKECVFEAAFSYDKVFAAVDILQCKEGSNIALEVKSSYDIKDVYIMDCALQYYVISHNVTLSDFFLIYPNKEYIDSLGLDINDLKGQDLDLEQLFKRRSILGEVQSLQPLVKQKIKKLKPLLKSKKEPTFSMGDYCTSPYNCEFIDYCSQHYKVD